MDHPEDPAQRKSDPARSSDHPDHEKPRLYRPPKSEDDESDRPKRKQPRNPNLPKSQMQKLWDELGHPDEPVNEMPGGTYNSAGGKPPEVTLWGTIKAIPQDITNIKYEEMTNVHKIPCAREGLLNGIYGGFVLGGLRAIAGGAVWTSCNWAVGGFAAVASGAYLWCKRSWAKEKAEMKMLVEAMRARKIKEAAKEREESLRREEENRRKEEERLRKSWTRWQNYRFW